ncbi:MAG TPA: DUF3106 domain-containing protein [Bryobacteraceae bacterium]|nr:DUF3106 domain-containing protein [Bryobacteraceae bacterium]
MISLRPILVSFLAGALIVPAWAGQGTRKGGGGGGGARVAQAPRATEARPQGRGNQNAQPKQPEVFNKVMRMSPEERQRALSKLPPARREQIEKRIQNFEKLPPAAQERRLDRLERLNSLPPQRQNQVRKSMKDLQQLPEDRKVAVNQELRLMAPMSDEERREHMNTEEFRNKYSPTEQQMMSNLAAVE